MSTTTRLGLTQGYPSKVPSHQADIFLESGVAQLPRFTPSGGNVFYNFSDSNWLQTQASPLPLHKSRSSNVLATQQAHGSDVFPGYQPPRSATPQPKRPSSQALQIQVTQKMRDEAVKFEDIVAKYNKGRDVKLQVKFGKCTTFDELATELNRLQQVYEKAKDSKNDVSMRLRIFARKTHEASSVVNSWLRLLPGESKELSVLVGGLSILFDVCDVH